MGTEPGCAVWPVAALPVIRSALQDGRHPPTWRVLEELGAHRLRVDPPTLFANVNTREELACLEAGAYQR
jgi:molybdopterin-guanine dinucleotide biosynthesis protein A